MAFFETLSMGGVIIALIGFIIIVVGISITYEAIRKLENSKSNFKGSYYLETYFVRPMRWIIIMGIIIVIIGILNAINVLP